jgi:hypothetical protein
VDESVIPAFSLRQGYGQQAHRLPVDRSSRRDRRDAYGRGAGFTKSSTVARLRYSGTSLDENPAMVQVCSPEESSECALDTKYKTSILGA